MLPKIEHRKSVEPFGYRVWHPENFKLGSNVDIGTMTVIHAHNGVTIEDDVKIGPHCTILSRNDIKQERNNPVLIKKGSHIGAYTLIMPGSIVEGIVPAYTYFDNANITMNEAREKYMT